MTERVNINWSPVFILGSGNWRRTDKGAASVLVFCI